MDVLDHAVDIACAIEAVHCAGHAERRPGVRLIRPGGTEGQRPALLLMLVLSLAVFVCAAMRESLPTMNRIRDSCRWVLISAKTGCNSPP